MTYATCGTWIAYPYEAPVVSVVRVSRSSDFDVMFCW
jgi:hypothetical protein